MDATELANGLFCDFLHKISISFKQSFRLTLLVIMLYEVGYVWHMYAYDVQICACTFIYAVL